MMSVSSVHINVLPDSVLLEIFSYLEQVDLHLSVSRVCRRWKPIGYDKTLWSQLNQNKFEQSIGCQTINTARIQRSVFQKVHLNIKQLFVSEEGLSLITFLDYLSLPSLQEMYLPEGDYKYIRGVSESVKNIQRTTSAKVYLGHCKYHRLPLCCKDSIYFHYSLMDPLGFEDPFKCPISYASDMEWPLGLDQNYHSVIFENDAYLSTLGVPAKLILKMAYTRNLLHLKVNNMSLKVMDDLPENEVHLFCSKLQSLTLQNNTTPEAVISKMLYHAHLLQRLELWDVSTCLSIVPTCAQLTGLELWNLNDSNYLCEIAYHCRRLRRIVLVDGCLKLNEFLNTLAERSKGLVCLKLKSIKREDNDLNDTDGFNKLLLQCLKLKTVHMKGLYLKIPPLHFDGYISLESLRVGKYCEEPGSIKTIPLQTLTTMKYLNNFELRVEESISVEFMKTLSTTCTNMTKLVVSECGSVSNTFNIERGSQLLDQIHLKLLNIISLKLKDTSFSSKSVEDFIIRSRYLTCLHIVPSLDFLSINIGNSPHKREQYEGEYRLKLLPQIK